MKKTLLFFLLLCFTVVTHAKHLDLALQFRVDKSFTPGLKVTFLFDGVSKLTKIIPAGEELETVIDIDVPPQTIKIIAAPADSSPADNCGNREYVYESIEGIVANIGVMGRTSNGIKSCHFTMFRISKKS